MSGRLEDEAGYHRTFSFPSPKTLFPGSEEAFEASLQHNLYIVHAKLIIKKNPSTMEAALTEHERKITLGTADSVIITKKV